MFKLAVLIIGVLAIFCFNTSVAQPDKIVCYFDSWANYRPSKGAFEIDDIDPLKCTHLVYSFVGIKGDGNLAILDDNNDINKGGFKKFNNLKKKNPNLKTLLAVGGWNAGSKPFSDVAKNANALNTLASSALRFMDDYGFNGFDIDWEYPAQRGGEPEDKNNFYTMIKVLRKNFDATGRKYLLTTAVSVGNWMISQSYDIPNIARDLDFINFMSYDFHNPGETKTGSNAPLYAHSSDSPDNNIDACVSNWINKGVPPEKLILGIPTYGKSYNLVNRDQHNIGSPSSGTGPAGPYTNDAGTLSYAEVCEKIKYDNWNTVWDQDQWVPYMYKDNTWISYEDTRSVKEKVNYAKNKQLGGIMIWSISMDDFNGLCGSKYPLLSEINRNLFGGSGNNGVSQKESENIWVPPKESVPPPPPPPSTSNKCFREGMFRDSKTCTKFYRCVANNGGYIMYNFDCAGGLYFNEKYQTCDYSYNVPC